MASDLSWTHFIHDISSKARQKAAWVLSIFHSRLPDIMLTLYKPMVRNLLEYCCPTGGFSGGVQGGAHPPNFIRAPPQHVLHPPTFTCTPQHFCSLSPKL